MVYMDALGVQMNLTQNYTNMATYQCIKCGYEIRGQSDTPSTNPLLNGTCEVTKGRHIWIKTSGFFRKLFTKWNL